jgi:putative oxidoreductase
MNLKAGFNRLESSLTAVGNFLASPLLLVLRLYWGWQLVLTGRGKLTHLDGVTQYFASLHVPAPHLNAMLAGGTELVGGVLLILGLGTRFITLPLTVLLVLAYVTADRAAWLAFFSAPDKFIAATPFSFLLVVLILFSFGPGRVSLDAWRQRPGAAG